MVKSLFVVLLALMTLGATGRTPPKSYVALGDSYTAGPANAVQNGNPPGCYRSDHNYPHLVAPNLNLSVFRDVSCSGAQTRDMTSSQSVSPSPNPPPQFDALDPNTRAVSLTIGGNDIGFTEIIQNCVSPVNSGTPCQDRYVVNGDDEISDRINAAAPKVAAVLQGIRSRSPRAKIFLLGYLDILPDSGVGCYPQMPVTDGDVPYLRDKERQLNATLKSVAAANRSVYVDTYTPSIGHDACQLPTVRWVEPLAPVPPTYPVHPNQAGMNAVRDILLPVMHQAGF
jgi:lysophospholipase L1-like esterase